MNKPDTDALVSGNGRIEATEINVSSKLSGQLEEILVKEGDFVEPGQILARVKISTLEAQLRELKHNSVKPRMRLRQRKHKWRCGSAKKPPLKPWYNSVKQN